jgi:hypothetical protein
MEIKSFLHLIFRDAAAKLRISKQKNKFSFEFFRTDRGKRVRIAIRSRFFIPKRGNVLFPTWEFLLVNNGTHTQQRAFYLKKYYVFQAYEVKKCNLVAKGLVNLKKRCTFAQIMNQRKTL